jgi:hypothetical protein
MFSLGTKGENKYLTTTPGAIINVFVYMAAAHMHKPTDVIGKIIFIEEGYDLPTTMDKLLHFFCDF